VNVQRSAGSFTFDRTVLGSRARTTTPGLVQDAELVVSGEVDALVREADELIAIKTASIKTAKQCEVTSCGEARSWSAR